MRIATFNLESLTSTTRGGIQLAERKDILCPQLDRLNADILCLQEINGQRLSGQATRWLHALDELLAGTKYEDYHRVSTSGRDGQGVADVHNLVILSRFAIRNHAEIHHNHVRPIEYRPLTAEPPTIKPLPVTFDRPLLMAEVELKGGTSLFLLNSHLRAPLASHVPGQKEAPFVWKSVSGWAEGYFISAVKRAAQALEMRLVVEQILDADPHALIAACGDFNAEDHETAIKILVGAEEDTGNGRLAHRALIVADRSIPQDRRFSVLHHGRRQMLDHLLISRTLMAHLSAVECHNEALEDEAIGYAKVQHSTASYHAPLLAEFSFG